MLSKLTRDKRISLSIACNTLSSTLQENIGLVSAKGKDRLATGLVTKSPVRTHIRSMACHEVASANILAKLASTFVARVPTSATLIENSGFLAATATVSAVEVFPTPGGPLNLLVH